MTREERRRWRLEAKFILNQDLETRLRAACGPESYDWPWAQLRGFGNCYSQSSSFEVEWGFRGCKGWHQARVLSVRMVRCLRWDLQTLVGPDVEVYVTQWGAGRLKALFKARVDVPFSEDTYRRMYLVLRYLGTLTYDRLMRHTP
jgi:hypothetical protein